MPRFARIVVPGAAYHVTHRGNRKGEIFFRDEDREAYRRYLAEEASEHELEIWAYCWMSNHVHLVVVGHRADSLARAIGIAHRRYARYVNRRHEWTGHLWANRFHSTLLGGSHVLNAIRYVELNPVRAGLVAEAGAYPWSSARARCQGVDDSLLARRRPLPGAISDWRSWLAEGLEPEALEALRRSTSSGCPCAPPESVRSLEKHLGRRLWKARGQVPI